MSLTKMASKTSLGTSLISLGLCALRSDSSADSCCPGKLLPTHTGFTWTGTGCCVTAVCLIQSPLATVVFLLDNCMIQVGKRFRFEFDVVIVLFSCCCSDLTVVVGAVYVLLHV